MYQTIHEMVGYTESDIEISVTNLHMPKFLRSVSWLGIPGIDQPSLFLFGF